MGKVSALWVHASADWIKMMNGIGLTCSYVFVIKEAYQNLYQFCFCCILMPLVKFKRNGLWRGWMGCVVGVWNNYNTSVCVCHLSRRTAGPMMSWAPNTWGETSTTPGRLQRWPSWVLRYKTHKQINTPTLCVRGDMTFHGKVISLFKETIHACAIQAKRIAIKEYFCILRFPYQSMDVCLSGRGPDHLQREGQPGGGWGWIRGEVRQPFPRGCPR